MSTPHLRLSSPIGAVHPAVMNRRIRELGLLGLTALIPLLIALGIAREVPNPSILLTLGLVLGALGILVLVVSTRYEVTLALVALYLGLLEGPVKLGTGGGAAASASRDVLIGAITLGAVTRVIVRRERVRLPPMSGWVLAFVALVAVEAFNPGTHGILKVLGGVRQELEWMPFFFFGYLLMRSKERFRKYFLLLGVIALVNGAVGTYQVGISPDQLASWGPGYAELVEGGGAKKVSAQTYISEGVARVRPPALGSQGGFGGGVGVLALPGLLALLATARLRRGWIVPLLCLGPVAGVATSVSRTAVIGAVVAVVAFALLSFSAGRRVARPLMAFLVVMALALAVGSILASTEGAGIFSRFSSIASPGQAVSTSFARKEKTWTQIPSDIVNAPFGIGLASAASASGFGGIYHHSIEEHGVSGESWYNSVVLELGVAGLLLWIALSGKLVALVARRLQNLKDSELRIYLAAVFASVFAFVIMGFSGPTMAAPPAGPSVWFAVGIAAYWFVGPGRRASPTTGEGGTSIRTDAG